MTQQPYAAPQYPQAPPQQYAPPPPAYPQAPPAQQFAQPGYPQAYAPAPVPQQPSQPLAQGSLSDYYAQPSAGTGPSIAWTDKATNQPKPLNTSYVGIVARDVTDADVQQQTDFRTQAPKFYRDGRPMFAMKVPLRVQPTAEFPEGEASWYVKGQARDELVRAMAEAGVTGSPKGGALIRITLVQRRSSGAGLNPANIVRVEYDPTGGTGAPSPAPVPAEPITQQVAPPVAPPVVQAPVEQQPYVAPAAPQATVQAPADFSPEQAALLARLSGQGQPA